MNQFEWESTPMINLIDVRVLSDTEFKTYRDQTMQMHMASNKDGAVKFHKSRLGRQKFTWTGSARNWIWEGENWRVFASKRGTAFEVRANLTPEECFEAWKDYRKKVGLADES
jgi:hypothetical protein